MFMKTYTLIYYYGSPVQCECVLNFLYEWITCKVLVDPITSLLLPVVWNDITVSCLSGGLTYSSDKTHHIEGEIVIDKMWRTESPSYHLNVQKVTSISHNDSSDETLASIDLL